MSKKEQLFTYGVKPGVSLPVDFPTWIKKARRVDPR